MSKRPSVHGALIIDKPAGVTSHDVVSLVRKAYDTREVGHAGTLDPIATGLLICLLGEATKLSQYVMSEEKSYRVGIKFGVKTDSADISGKVMSEKFSPKLQDILNDTTSPDEASKWLREKIATLVGNLKLPVPKYSAVKVAGKKLYEYARADEDVEIPVKEMVIKEASLIEWGPGKAVVDLHCEKGTYVRSWVEKFGEIMESDATVESLVRTQSGPFDLKQSVTVEKLNEMPSDKKSEILIPLADVLGGWMALKVLGRDESLVRNGQIPKGVYSQILHAGLREKGVRVLDEKNKLLAIIIPEESKGLKLARVFN